MAPDRLNDPASHLYVHPPLCLSNSRLACRQLLVPEGGSVNHIGEGGRGGLLHSTRLFSSHDVGATLAAWGFCPRMMRWNSYCKLKTANNRTSSPCTAAEYSVYNDRQMPFHQTANLRHGHTASQKLAHLVTPRVTAFTSKGSKKTVSSTRNTTQGPFGQKTVVQPHSLQAPPIADLRNTDFCL